VCSSDLYPTSLLLEIEKSLSQIDSPFDVMDQLNIGTSGSIGEYFRLAKQDSFLLSEAPCMAAYKAIKKQLDEQKVDYTILKARSPKYPKLFVTIGSTNLFCKKAVVNILDVYA